MNERAKFTPHSDQGVPSSKDVRGQLFSALEQFIARAITQYRVLVSHEPPFTIKGMAAHHVACRAALGHLEQLLRIIDDSTANKWHVFTNKQDDHLHAIISEARAHIKDIEHDETEIDKIIDL